jgi:hypothetical protein
MFDNGDTVGNDTDLGKYFIDRNANGVKDGPCVTSSTDECQVDTWYNYAEGDLKGTYTPIGAANKALVRPNAQKPVAYGALHDFTDTATFIASVDNSMAGQMRDCGECHVGGGAMEYVPVAQGTVLDPGARVELRADQTGTMVGAGVNTFNYFIDQYDEDSDGVLGEALPQNYADSGVLEMDCLMCHLEGYSWENRMHAVRKGNFDASRVAGAGLGAADNADGSMNIDGAGAGTGYGKVVTYDPLMVASDAGNATLSATVLNSIQATPPSSNCSSCHFDLHQVDWKKRGATWTENMSYETEVHGSLGCMGCHTRDDGIEMDPNNTLAGTPDSPLFTGNAKSGADAATVGHDPSKGVAPFSSLWNKNDGNVRSCAGCHTDDTKSYYGHAGAPDPTARHAQLGLMQTLIQTGGMTHMDGTPNGNHLDVISCEGCHTKKLGHGPLDTHSDAMYEWGTGGALVDSTGPDAEGRLTDHENLYVERTMENNMTVSWQGNKIGPRNALITMFWRDKDELFGVGNVAGDNYIDINVDGQDGAMDAVNPSHVRNAMRNAGIAVLTHDGTFDSAEIAAQKSALSAYLPTAGVDYLGKSPKLKLSFMGVFFKANHGTTPAASAWGAGGCKDCHGADKGFYNGPYDLKPRDLTASWTNNSGSTDDSAIGGKKPKWSHVVPFTKVNADNYSGRDVTLPICSSYYGPSPRPAAPAVGDSADVGLACTNPDTGAAGTWTLYALGRIKADYQFSDFHPTTWAKGQPGRTIAITAAFGGADTIRTMDRSEGLWEKSFVTGSYDGTITGTDGNAYATRSAWVAYLNGRGNYRPAIHEEHAAYDCSVCHSDGSAPVGGTNQGWSLVSDADLPAAEQFTHTVNPVSGTATCATQCHDVASVGAAPDVATARISSQHATDTNFSVNLDGSKSACYNVDLTTGQVTQGTNTYAWTVTGTTTQNTCVGNVANCDVTWDAAGTNNVTLDVSCDAGGTASSATIGVTGFDVGAGGNVDPTLTATVAGNTVTLEAPTLDGEVNDVQILWGDFTRLTVTTATSPNVTDLINASGIAGVAHTYTESGSYSVTVVTTNDGDPNNTQYTYPLTVVIP